MTTNSPLSLAVYSADAWTHACLMVRLGSPARRVGWKLIQGAEWVDGALCVYPQRAAQADVVVITRDFPVRAGEYQQVVSEARSRGAPVVYETDDLLLELPPSHPDYERYLVARAAMLRAVVEADAVVGSTPDLCDYLGAFNPHTRLWENYLDENLWQLDHLRPAAIGSGDTSQDQPVIIGYMGGHSHSTDLEAISPALLQVLDKYPARVRLKFWGLEPPESLRQHPAVELDPVLLIDYPSFAAYFSAQHCDIFIAPLLVNLFNRCKSSLKFLEYSALASPGVYSRIEPYQRVVKHGQNGFLAGETDEWVSCLSQLVEDASLRLRLGAAAQATLRSQWLLSERLDQFERIYRDLVPDPLEAKNYVSASPPYNGDGSRAEPVARKMAAFYQELIQKRETENRPREQWDALYGQLAEQQRALLNLSRIAQEYYSLYLDIVTSRSWHLMQRLIAWRLRLAPLGSRRERFVRAFYQSAVALKNHGLGASFRTAQASFRLLKQPPARPAGQTSPVVQTLLFTGTSYGQAACNLPAISIIVMADGDAAPLGAADLLGWLRAQTLRQAAQVVIWDRVAGEAALLNSLAAPWKADNVSALLQGLQTPYICLASPDLLEQEATYLETNLCALQSGSLAFTVNLRGPSPWAIRRLEQGWLPGDRSRPLLRQVVRKECVVDDFVDGRLAEGGMADGHITLDLHPWLASRQAALGQDQKAPDQGVVVGRVLSLTSNRFDSEDDLPFERPARFLPALIERDLVSSAGSDRLQSILDNPPLAHTLLPMDKAMPVAPEHSELPTVLLVMPYMAVGGAEKIALKIIQYLAGQVRFVVLTFDDLDPQLGTMADDFRWLTPYVYSLPDFAHTRLNASALDYLIGRFDPCTIYIHNGLSWIYDALDAIKHRYPHIRLVNQVYHHEVGWITRYDPALVLYLDAHIGSNPKICEAYRHKGVRPEQIYFIENGSDSQDLDPGEYNADRLRDLRLKLGLPDQARIVTFASRLHPQKRPMDFIELARRFSSDPHLAFLMAGDGPLAVQVDEQIRRLGLRNVYRIPFYQPISDLLALTDVLVLPSEFEGMPMIVIEAQTMGKPVVVTDVGNNREIIERTQGGIVLGGIGDVSAMMSAVRQMLDQPPDPTALRRNTLAHFDWKVVAQKYRTALLADCDA